MSRPVLALAGVTKDYPGRGRNRVQRALDGFELEVPAGQVVGLLGPNGSGKSTALKIAAGLVWPTRGTGFVGKDPLGTRAAQRRTGYLPERGGLLEHLSARETLTSWLAMDRDSSKTTRDLAEAWLQRVDLVAAADQRVETFSKGMRQRLGLARALMVEPDLILLDEPFSGIDPIGVDLLVSLIREQAARGAAVVLSSHLLQRVEDVCDAVVLLAEGRMLARGSLAELMGTPVSRLRGLDDVYRECLNGGSVT